MTEGAISNVGSFLAVLAVGFLSCLGMKGFGDHSGADPHSPLDSPAEDLLAESMLDTGLDPPVQDLSDVDAPYTEEVVEDLPDDLSGDPSTADLSDLLSPDGTKADFATECNPGDVKCFQGSRWTCSGGTWKVAPCPAGDMCTNGACFRNSAAVYVVVDNNFGTGAGAVSRDVYCAACT